MAISKIKVGTTEHELQTTIANVTNLQASLDAKQPTITGGASTITSSNLTASRALVSNSSGKVAVSAVTSTELGYLDGVTSNIQTQLDSKVDLTSDQIVTGFKTFKCGDNVSLCLDDVVIFETDYLNNIPKLYFLGGNSDEAVRLSNVYTPVNNYDATNKLYVDTKISALYGGKIGKSGSSGTSSEIFNAYTYNTASGNYSHAEGHSTTASGDWSHAEGHSTTASGDYSHAEGYNTTAHGDYSHAEGHNTIASGDWSHAEGYNCKAASKYVHAEGVGTIAQVYNVHVQGHYNTDPTSGSTTGTYGTAFVIGNGTSSTRSNAFRVSYAGKPYALSSLNTSGADYAEFFEWLDSNPDGEDRRGYFVTLDGDKIKIAEPGDYILGIISALPAVIGNGDEDWKGRYILDDFGAFITEEFEYDMEEPVEIVDEETGETKIETQIVKKTGTKYKENPNYDPSVPYIQREDRPEWDTVGMMGVLAVRDDGTCKVNGYCKVTEGGIATTSENGYRVIARVNENIVKVVFR